MTNSKLKRGHLSAGWKAAIDALSAEIELLNDCADRAIDDTTWARADTRAGYLSRGRHFLEQKATDLGIDIS